MMKISRITTALILMIGVLSSCQAVGDIFKTGVGFGVFGVVAVIVLIIYFVTKRKS